MLGAIAVTRVTLGSGSLVLQAPLLVHVGAGVAGTVTGFVALAAVKGGQLHRRIGTWFVCSMVVMGLVGAAIATYEVKIGSIDGGLLAVYLVTTALTTVRPRTPAVRRFEHIAMVVALGTGITNIRLRRTLRGLVLAGAVSGD